MATIYRIANQTDMSFLQHLTESERAYIGGLFDGEGYVGLYKGKHDSSPKVWITITNTNKPILDWLKSKLAGSVVSHGKPKKVNHRESWHWVAANYQAREILKVLLPYLRIKRDKVVEILTLGSSYRTDKSGST